MHTETTALRKAGLPVTDFGPVLHGVPAEAREASALPGAAGGFDALHDLVVRVRSTQPG